MNGTGGGTPLKYAQVKLTQNISFTANNGTDFDNMFIPFSVVDYDPNMLWNSGSNYFTLPSNTTWEIGATITTFSWTGITIIHIVDFDRQLVIKSVIANPSQDYDTSISINCIFQVENATNIAILMEGTNSGTILSSYSTPVSAKTPRITSTSLTYFWIHQIA